MSEVSLRHTMRALMPMGDAVRLAIALAMTVVASALLVAFKAEATITALVMGGMAAALAQATLFAARSPTAVDGSAGSSGAAASEASASAEAPAEQSLGKRPDITALQKSLAEAREDLRELQQGTLETIARLAAETREKQRTMEHDLVSDYLSRSPAFEHEKGLVADLRALDQRYRQAFDRPRAILLLRQAAAWRVWAATVREKYSEEFAHGLAELHDEDEFILLLAVAEARAFEDPDPRQLRFEGPPWRYSGSPARYRDPYE